MFLNNPFVVYQRAGGGDEGILEEFEGEGDDEPCYGKRCTANEHCCPGSVCVDVDGGNLNFSCEIFPSMQ